MGSPQLDEHTHYYYELIFCELAQLVVDYLLHALQDLRYLRSLHKEGAGRRGRWIMNIIELITLFGFTLHCFRSLKQYLVLKYQSCHGDLRYLLLY